MSYVCIRISFTLLKCCCYYRLNNYARALQLLRLARQKLLMNEVLMPSDGYAEYWNVIANDRV